MELVGRLRVQRPGEPDQEFSFSKASVTVGRAEVNDIVLTDPKVSRAHALFEWRGGACTVTDLGSANGTEVNGVRLPHATLTSGDAVRLGDSTFRFEPATPPAGAGSVPMGTTDEAGGAHGGDALQMTLAPTDRPRLTVFTPGHTWEIPLDADAVTIGRDLDADVPLPFPEASRRHARIEWRRGRLVVRDLGSANGTWLGGRRLDEHTLANGDTVRIGPARLTFKNGFEQEDLTVVHRPGDAGARRTPVVFVTGFMGSELWRGSERVWPNVRYLLSDPGVFRLPEATALEPRAVAREVVIVPNLIKLERYNRVADFLVDALGYERGKDVIEFAYDWRQDVRLSAKLLARAIDEWNVQEPVTIIAHSLGCLVSRWYVERLGGKAKINRLVLVGGPHLGTPRAATDMVFGPKMFPFRLIGDRLSEVLATFPSTYQLLPWESCGTDQDGRPLNLFADDRWLPEAARPLLREARAFRRALGTRSSVPAVSIFGYGLKTVTSLNVNRDDDGRWQRVDSAIATAGDERVPETSAVLPGSEIHPVQQSHGALYVDNDVKMRLKLELTGGRERG